MLPQVRSDNKQIKMSIRTIKDIRLEKRIKKSQTNDCRTIKNKQRIEFNNDFDIQEENNYEEIEVLMKNCSDLLTQYTWDLWSYGCNQYDYTNDVDDAYSDV